MSINNKTKNTKTASQIKRAANYKECRESPEFKSRLEKEKKSKARRLENEKKTLKNS